MSGLSSRTPRRRWRTRPAERSDLALRFVACLRLLCPEALIPATTALGALHPEGRQRALRAGANVLMPNCTPMEYRERYQLYPGKICTGEAAAECRQLRGGDGRLAGADGGAEASVTAGARSASGAVAS